ncbi:hypothetical protein N9L48_03855, partial [Psychrosphaera sp.]|nr:hypothetical protein [Psychrosphaera sp.]
MKRIIVLITVSLIASVIIGMLALSSYLARWAVEEVFLEQELTLQENFNLNYDPFIGEVTISDAALLHQKSNEIVSFKTLIINFDLLPLLSKTLKVNHFEFTGLDLKIDQQPNSPLTVGGWSTANFNSKNESKIESDEEKLETNAQQSEPLINQIQIGIIVFKDLN